MQPEEEKAPIKAAAKISRYAVFISLAAVVCICILVISLIDNGRATESAAPVHKPVGTHTVNAGQSSSIASKGGTARTIPANAWKAPDESAIPAGIAGDRVRFGKELIAHTASYFGPHGSIATITNGMNCQNCHLAAGTKLFSNDFAGFVAAYPKMSARSGKVEPASERIAECFERSLAGKVPDTSGKEVQAILAYMKWIGQGIQKGGKLFGSGTEKLALMDHAADPAKGKEVFVLKCQACHGSDGDGMLANDKKNIYQSAVMGKA